MQIEAHPTEASRAHPRQGALFYQNQGATSVMQHTQDATAAEVGVILVSRTTGAGAPGAGAHDLLIENKLPNTLFHASRQVNFGGVHANGRHFDDGVIANHGGIGA